jgi:hypothetical protein
VRPLIQTDGDQHDCKACDIFARRWRRSDNPVGYAKERTGYRPSMSGSVRGRRLRQIQSRRLPTHQPVRSRSSDLASQVEAVIKVIMSSTPSGRLKR